MNRNGDAPSGADAVACRLVVKLLDSNAQIIVKAKTIYWDTIKLELRKEKGYSGTSIWSREKPKKVELGLGIEEHDLEGRVITATYESSSPAPPFRSGQSIVEPQLADCFP